MEDLLMKKVIEINDFFDKDGNLLTSLISDTASSENGGLRSLINLLMETVTEQVEEQQGRRPPKPKKINEPLKNSQLRKFYDSFIKIYNAQINEEQKKVQLLMLKSNAEYSANRLNIRRFGIFLNNRINIVLNKKGNEFNKYMDALKLHFEALVGYFPKN